MRTLVGIAVGLILGEGVMAQNHLRMQGYASTKPSKAERAIEVIDATRLEGALPGTSSDLDVRAASAVRCPASSQPYCTNLWLISRDNLATTWAQAADKKVRAGVALAIDRATKDAVTDWSKAEAAFDIWKMEYDDPGYAERASRFAAGLRSYGYIETNCASDTWAEGTRIRSRFYCW
ncbi:MAG: hypothetical protein KGZ61_07310 [Sandarakinorhabdus sp.]|nr:hypothetical protein [Sandarakinorhabdus sp.]